uniref:Uncharacterized protein n=1 Tax=Candidatus Kentrum sp. TUN TaxID=2126343 RepID=A0A450ZV75_9GAMM|nr:MAG: hypothetical protein BECKTUN1418D_GA0071000_10676 [Candidatus Kentron sp. TUN]
MVLPVLAYPVDSIRQCALFALKGLRISAQGCCVAATLGRERRDRQPQRGCVKTRHKSKDATPLGLRPMVFGSQGSASRNPGLDYVAPSEQKRSKSNRYRFLDLVVALPRQTNPHNKTRETDRTATNESNTIGWRANGRVSGCVLCGRGQITSHFMRIRLIIR